MTEEPRELRTFKIEDVFNVGGTKTTHPSRLETDGKLNTPRVTTAATNNGVDAMYSNAPTEAGGVIVIDSATVGFVSYQPYAFIATDHVEKLTLRGDRDFSVKELDTFLGLYLVAAIRAACFGKYNYGYKFSQVRIRRQLILLPVVGESEQPDWEYMRACAERAWRDAQSRILEDFWQVS